MMVAVYRNPSKSILLVFNISSIVLGRPLCLSYSEILWYEVFSFFLIKDYSNSTLSFKHNHRSALILNCALNKSLPKNQVPWPLCVY